MRSLLSAAARPDKRLSGRLQDCATCTTKTTGIGTHNAHNQRASVEPQHTPTPNYRQRVPTRQKKPSPSAHTAAPNGEDPTASSTVVGQYCSSASLWARTIVIDGLPRLTGRCGELHLHGPSSNDSVILEIMVLRSRA